MGLIGTLKQFKLKQKGKTYMKRILTTMAVAALLAIGTTLQAQTYITNVVTSVGTNSSGVLVTTVTTTINVVTIPPTNNVVVYETNGVATTPPVTISPQNFLVRAYGDLKNATNYGVIPYATYAPKAPTKMGAGVLVLYNVNNYVGAGIGLDWLGGFSMVSGNVQLKLPIKLSTIGFGFMSGLTNDFIVPFGLAGIGTPFSGSSGPSTIEDVGAYLQFGHLWGGQFVVGATYGKWIGNGPYNTTRYHGFAGWKIGF